MPDEPSKRFQLQKVAPRHHNIMRLQAAGFTGKEISELTELTETAISLIINSDVYKDQYSKFKERLDADAIEKINKPLEIKETISIGAKMAAEELLEMMKEAKKLPLKLRAEVCWDFLDRDGHKAPEKREIVHDYATAAVRAYENRKAELAKQQNPPVIPYYPTTVEASTVESETVEASEDDDATVH